MVLDPEPNRSKQGHATNSSGRFNINNNQRRCCCPSQEKGLSVAVARNWARTSFQAFVMVWVCGVVVAAAVDSPETTAAANPASWRCIENTVLIFEMPYQCWNVDPRGVGQHLLHPTMPPTAQPIFFCRHDNITEPNLDDCAAFCVIMDFSHSPPQDCSSCALLPSGDVSYDCRNLYNKDNNNNTQTICATRAGRNNQNSPNNNNCEPYVHWDCTFARGHGKACFQRNNEPIPSLPLEIWENTTLVLYCRESISGLPSSACYNETTSICAIYGDGDGLACSSCELLPSGDFAYDCTNLFPRSTCPRRDAEGTCFMYKEGNETIGNSSSTDIDKASSPSEDESGWVLENVNPTVFNVCSDIFALFSMVLFGMSLSSLYYTLADWKLRSGGKIPLNDLGHVPGHFAEAAHMVKQWRGAFQGLFFAALVSIGDFSHAIADVGLSFETVNKEGPMETVLVISPFKQNPARPMETAGDPLQFRTYATAEGGFQVKSLIFSYLAAVELIAQGESPFVSDTSTQARVPRVIDEESPFGAESSHTTQFDAAATAAAGGLLGINFYYPEDESPLHMNHTIPLVCKPEMKLINQYSQAFFMEVKVEHTASIPDCDFKSVRETGIFANKVEDTVQILEVFEITVSDGAVCLNINGTCVQNFVAAPKDKLLARDRDDWMKGRVFSGIDGVTIGNTTITLQNVVLASGGDAETPAEVGLAGGLDHARNTEYGLVASLGGDCPKRPSGLNSTNTVCLAILTISCPPFWEDYASVYHPIYYPSVEGPTNCSFGQGRISFVWGRGFVPNGELAAVVAGLFGIIKPNLWDGSYRKFVWNSIPAALFALGVIEQRPSNQTDVHPRINGIYISFMLLPVFLAAVCFAVVLYTRKSLITLPKSNWEMMVMGKEQPMIPVRRSGTDKFPTTDSSCFFVLTKEQEHGSRELFLTVAVDLVSQQYTSEIDEDEHSTEYGSAQIELYETDELGTKNEVAMDEYPDQERVEDI